MSHTNRNIVVLAIVCIVLLALSPTLISGQIPDVDHSTDGHMNSLIELTNGTISVVSEPSDADTFLEGISTGRQTPCMLMEVSPGKHLIEVSKPGYVSDSAQVEVFRGKTTNIRFVLVRVNGTSQAHGDSNPGTGGSSNSGGSFGSETDPGSGGTPSEGSASFPDGSIRVTSSQPGAAVFIRQPENGLTIESDTGLATPATLEKEPGDYEVSVSLDGYHAPPPKSLTVVSGQQTDVDFTLIPIVNTPEFPSLSFPVLAISVFALAVCGIRLRKD